MSIPVPIPFPIERSGFARSKSMLDAGSWLGGQQLFHREHFRSPPPTSLVKGIVSIPVPIPFPIERSGFARSKKMVHAGRSIAGI